MINDCENTKKDIEIIIKYQDSGKDSFLSALAVYTASDHKDRATVPFSRSNHASW